MIKNNLTILITIIIIVVINMLLISCSSIPEENTIEYNPIHDESVSKESGLIYIKGSQSLVYRADTRIVYIMFDQAQPNTSNKQGYLTPYISVNGYYCKYTDERIVEIKDSHYLIIKDVINEINNTKNKE